MLIKSREYILDADIHTYRAKLKEATISNYSTIGCELTISFGGEATQFGKFAHCVRRPDAAAFFPAFLSFAAQIPEIHSRSDKYK